MNLNFKKYFFLTLLLIFTTENVLSKPYLESLIRERAIAEGYKLPNETHQKVDKDLVQLGKVFFESKNLSLNGNVACASCHFNSAASADGLPNAFGIGGDGEGISRYKSGGKIVPRNTLALWGVGSIGFETFFWDGRVNAKSDNIVSQFGNNPPSDDLLIVAVHLPVVEIRETLEEDSFVQLYKKETTDAANEIYKRVVNKLVETENDAVAKLASELNIKVQEVGFADIALSIAHFIRDEFKLRPSKFSNFMDGENTLNENELNGALVFYGKGGCVSCHSGPYFSDFNFYTIPFPQLGFGKNGFGVDYGLYNTTFDPMDQYKFRTPSLHNVSLTGPYGHSGSVFMLKDTIRYHFDPLHNFNASELSPLKRHEYYKYLAKNDTLDIVQHLNDREIEELVSFLKTLEFDSND